MENSVEILIGLRHCDYTENYSYSSSLAGAKNIVLRKWKKEKSFFLDCEVFILDFSSGVEYVFLKNTNSEDFCFISDTDRNSTFFKKSQAKSPEFYSLDYEKDLKNNFYFRTNKKPNYTIKTKQLNYSSFGGEIEEVLTCDNGKNYLVKNGNWYVWSKSGIDKLEVS